MGTEYVVFARVGDRFKQISVLFDAKEDAEDFLRWYRRPNAVLTLHQIIATSHCGEDA